MSNLSAAINRLYQAFSVAPRPGAIDGCPCCITEYELESLRTKPLRKLTADELSSYASSAFLTVGDIPDYLYLLPRILELSAKDESWWPSIEVTARAITAAKLPDWSELRQRALRSFLEQFINHVLEKGEYHRIDEWMCGIGRMELDVAPFLSIVESNEKAVLEYWKDNSGKLHEGKLGNAFWDPPNDQHDQIVRWFQSPKINLIYAKEYGYRMD